MRVVINYIMFTIDGDGFYVKAVAIFYNLTNCHETNGTIFVIKIGRMKEAVMEQVMTNCRFSFCK